MRKNYLIFLFILMQLCFKAQIKFSNQYPNNGGSVSLNMFSINNTYCMFGITSNTFTNQYQGLAYIKTDANGVSEISKEIFHPNGNGFYSNNTANIFTNQFNKYVVSARKLTFYKNWVTNFGEIS